LHGINRFFYPSKFSLFQHSPCLKNCCCSATEILFKSGSVCFKDMPMYAYKTVYQSHDDDDDDDDEYGA